MDEEPANVAVDKDHVQSTVTVGSKVEVMFSNGPAAGSKAKFWIQENSETSNLEMPGYRTLGLNTPLGEAIEGAVSGEECRYTVSNVARRVVVTCID